MSGARELALLAFVATAATSDAAVPLDDSNFWDAIDLWFSDRGRAIIDYGHIENWDTSEVTDFSMAFEGRSNKDRSVFSPNLNAWDTSKVTDMEYLFNEAVNMNPLIGQWDTSKVTSMANMFAGTDTEENVFDSKIAAWETSQVEDMSGMFKYNSQFDQQGLYWTTDKVTDMSEMFMHSQFTGGEDISSWNVQKVKSMDMIFSESQFNMSYTIFWDTTSLEFPLDDQPCPAGYDAAGDYATQGTLEERCGEEYHSIWESINEQCAGDFPCGHNAECHGWSFKEDMVKKVCTCPFGEGGSGCLPPQIDDLSLKEMVKQWCENGDEAATDFFFEDPQNFVTYKYGPIAEWNIESVTHLNSADPNNFHESFFPTTCQPDLSTWNTAGITSMEHTFRNNRIFQGNLTKWNVGKVTSFAGMFIANKVFIEDIGWWNVSNGENFHSMFSGATEFNTDIGRWNMAKATDLTMMFNYAQRFNQDLPWSTSSLTSLERTFQDAYDFKGDISSWDTSQVTSMERTFQNTRNFRVSVEYWDTAKVQTFEHLLRDSSLDMKQLVLWDTSGEDHSDFNSHHLWSQPCPEGYTRAKHMGREVHGTLEQRCVMDGAGFVYDSKVCDKAPADLCQGHGTCGEFNFETLVNEANCDCEHGFRKTPTCDEGFAGLTDENIFASTRAWCGIYKDDMEYKFGPIADWDLSQVTKLEGANLNTPLIPSQCREDPDISKWNVSSVTSMWRVFTFSDFNGDIGKWNVGKVTSFSGMFYNSHFNRDISDWYTASGKDFEYMFAGAKKFNQPIGSWKMTSALNLKSMFADTDFTRDLPWELGQVTSMETVFAGGAFNGDVSTWSTASVESLKGAFRHNKRFDKGLRWDVSKARNMDEMFKGATQFSGRSLDTWTTSSLQTIKSMFEESGVGKVDLTSWDVSKVVDMTASFKKSPFNGNLSSWDTRSVTSFESMFEEANHFNPMELSLNVSQARSVRFMFKKATIFNGDLSKWQFGEYTDSLESLFEEAETFDRDISEWDTSRMVIMANVFRTAKAFKQPIGKWNTSRVVNFKNMFMHTTANYDVSKWNVHNAEEMQEMFNRNPHFNGDLGSWNVRKVRDIWGMFWEATNFNNCGVEKWDTQSLVKLAGSFGGTAHFDCDLSGWNVEKVSELNYAFFGAGAFTGKGLGKWQTGKVWNFQKFAPPPPSPFNWNQTALWDTTWSAFDGFTDHQPCPVGSKKRLVRHSVGYGRGGPVNVRCFIDGDFYKDFAAVDHCSVASSPCQGRGKCLSWDYGMRTNRLLCACDPGYAGAACDGIMCEAPSIEACINTLENHSVPMYDMKAHPELDFSPGQVSQTVTLGQDGHTVFRKGGAVLDYLAWIKMTGVDDNMMPIFTIRSTNKEICSQSALIHTSESTDYITTLLFKKHPSSPDRCVLDVEESELDLEVENSKMAFVSTATYGTVVTLERPRFEVIGPIYTPVDKGTSLIFWVRERGQTHDDGTKCDLSMVNAKQLFLGGACMISRSGLTDLGDGLLKLEYVVPREDYLKCSKSVEISDSGSVYKGSILFPHTDEKGACYYFSIKDSQHDFQLTSDGSPQATAGMKAMVKDVAVNSEACSAKQARLKFAVQVEGYVGTESGGTLKSGVFELLGDVAGQVSGTGGCDDASKTCVYSMETNNCFDLIETDDSEACTFPPGFQTYHASFTTMIMGLNVSESLALDTTHIFDHSLCTAPVVDIVMRDVSHDYDVQLNVLTLVNGTWASASNGDLVPKLDWSKPLSLGVSTGSNHVPAYSDLQITSLVARVTGVEDEIQVTRNDKVSHMGQTSEPYYSDGHFCKFADGHGECSRFYQKPARWNAHMEGLVSPASAYHCANADSTDYLTLTPEKWLKRPTSSENVVVTLKVTANVVLCNDHEHQQRRREHRDEKVVEFITAELSFIVPKDTKAPATSADAVLPVHTLAITLTPAMIMSWLNC